MGRTVSRTELEAGAGQGGGDDFFSIFPSLRSMAVLVGRAK